MSKNSNQSIQDRLANHGGRFTSLSVRRVKGGVTKYCARILKVTPKTVRFYDQNTGRSITVPVANVVA